MVISVPSEDLTVAVWKERKCGSKILNGDDPTQLPPPGA
ncbi:hypothetical protein FHR33_000291 [Nonomuraea dietziae]|uniref:Uncharacterized protein n=1 Tax=Nonomuraea dietziae TaxID=65515 RepID=A0A7W5Y4Q5_9ACTN|nr:hypothetical protein [Nonomuraea dietziae]